jgi:hypothetical protein
MSNVAKPASTGSAKRTVSPRKSGASGAKASPATRIISAAPRLTDLRAEIERRAYELWEAEGRPGGRDQSHWYRAEQELAQSRLRGPKRAPASAMAS